MQMASKDLLERTVEEIIELELSMKIDEINYNYGYHPVPLQQFRLLFDDTHHAYVFMELFTRYLNPVTIDNMTFMPGAVIVNKDSEGRYILEINIYDWEYCFNIIWFMEKFHTYFIKLYGTNIAYKGLSSDFLNLLDYYTAKGDLNDS